MQYHKGRTLSQSQICTNIGKRPVAMLKHPSPEVANLYRILVMRDILFLY